jgi:predicted DsbA family dithiol-disulfide isomerase
MRTGTHQLIVISDVICPWCYIGKKRLDTALKTLRQNYDIKICWKAFELNPTIPIEGIEREAYLHRKFGSKVAADSIYRNIKSVALEDKLEIAFELIKMTPNTRMSHKLIAATGGNDGKQDELIDALFEAYFVRGENIGDKEVLLKIAMGLKLSDQAINSLEENQMLESLVIAQEDDAKTQGVTGVPAFVYKDRLLFSGAQSPETMYLAIKRALERFAQ